MEKINMTVGRFQPFTIGHLNMINEGGAKCIVYQMIPAGAPNKLKGWKVDGKTVKKPEIENIVKYINTGEGNLTEHEKEIMKRPFSNELVAEELEIVKKNNPNILDVVYVKNMYDGLMRFNKFCTDNSDKYEPQYWMCGEDRVDNYSKEIGHYNELAVELGSSEVIPNILKGKLETNTGKGRTYGVSGTAVRTAIVKNDKVGFAKIMPKGVDSMFDKFKEAFNVFVEKIQGMLNENYHISLYDYILESLGDESIKKLSQYVSDENVNDIIPVIKRHISSQLSEEEKTEFTEFFKRHGIENLNWGGSSATEEFIRLFSKNDNIDTLKEIIKNNGVISVSDLPEKSNIFNFCNKINGKDLDWSNEAHTIAMWVHSTNTAAGPGEMLLKFMLYEGCDNGPGDVRIRKDENSKETDEMEVKSFTIKGSNKSGGHAMGQRGKIKDVNAIYNYLNDKLNIDEKQQSNNYFQGIQYISKFNDILKNVSLNEDEIITTIVDALCYQYNLSNDENVVKKLHNAALNNITFDKLKGFNVVDLLEFIGCCQLYLYSIVEGFKYFVVMTVVKSGNNSKNGDYILFNDCDTNNSPLLDFDKVRQYLTFKSLDGCNGSRGATGKIFMK